MNVSVQISNKRRRNTERSIKMAKDKGESIYPYYLKNGQLRYEAYAFNGNDKGSGKQRKRHKKGFLTYSEAKKWKKITEGQFASNTHIERYSEKLTIKQFTEDWIDIYKVDIKLGTKIKHRQVIDAYINPYIGNHRVSQYKLKDHQKFINFLITDKRFGKGKGLAPSSAKKISETVSAIFATAIKLEITSKNPTQGVTFPKKERDSTLKYLTYPQTELFLEEARNQKDPAWYPLFLTIFDQGLRKGEALGLEWNDIDFKNNMIYIRRTRVFAAERNQKWVYITDSPKTDSSIRDLPMTKRMKNAFLAYRNYIIGLFGYLPKTGDNQFIFIKTIYNNEIGTPFRGEAVNPAMNRILQAQGLPKIRVHDGRHTYAVRLRESGVNLDDIAELLGHSSTETTKIYAHITPEIKERAVDRLEVYLDAKSSELNQ